MNILNPNIKSISLIKNKQEKEIPLNPICNGENTQARKSLIKEKKLNKSKIKEKSPIVKFTTKTYFDVNNNNNYNTRKENLNEIKDLKKNLTQSLLTQFNTNKDIHNIKSIKAKDISSNKLNNKENLEYKIKVKKVADLNELTIHNITNDNTTSFNKNKKNKAFGKLDAENFEDLKKKQLHKNEGITVNKSDYKMKESKVEKDFGTRESRILKELPLFKNSLIINENIITDNLSKNFNNILDIETLPNMNYSELNSLNESNIDNTYNTPFIKKTSNEIFNKSESKFNKEKSSNRNQFSKESNNYSNSDNDKNLSLEENTNNSNNKKSEATIKETFTFFLHNNSKKEILNKNSMNRKEGKGRTRNNLTNKNNNNKSRIINHNLTIDEASSKADLSGKIEKHNNPIKKLTNNFFSPQKERFLKFSKTKNYFSSISNVFNNNNSNIISELNKKVENCNSILSYIEQNKKLKSEVEILTEKNKTLRKIQQNKNHEIEILKSKYSEAIESYKSEIEKNKSLKEKIEKQNSFAKNLKTKLKILANNLIEITELLLLTKSSAEKRTSLLAPENASLSIDIFDSYNNEEEKKFMLQEQIQALLLSKFFYFKKQLNLDLEAEIEKIKNWNCNPNFLNGRNINNNNNIEMSISNIKITALGKNNENDNSFESSKKNVSQDYFDLSISNQFSNLNQIPSGNFGNLSNNINININQNPQFIFTHNNYYAKQNPHDNSFGVIDGESDNIFGSNSNKNYNSNANSNNNNSNVNINNLSLNGGTAINNNLIDYNSNKEKRSNSNINNPDCSKNKKRRWTLTFNKEEQMYFNNCNWNNLNYKSNNREDKFIRIDSINNLIGANGTNKNVALSSNYNSNSNNIFDSFLHSAKGPNDSFSNSANDSILQIVNFNNLNSDKENKQANKSNKQLTEVEILNDIANDSLGKISNPVDLKEQINKIQNDSYNFIFEELKSKWENYNSDNQTKNKFICDELINNHINNNNIEIENFKDNFSEKNDGNKLKKMFSFEL